MTQKELGLKLGVSFQSIAQWENDLRKPKHETLQRIANALNVFTYTLLDDASKEVFFAGVTAGQDAVVREYSEFGCYSLDQPEAPIIEAFYKLNAEGQQKAIERVQELTEIPRYQYHEE